MDFSHQLESCGGIIPLNLVIITRAIALARLARSREFVFWRVKLVSLQPKKERSKEGTTLSTRYLCRGRELPMNEGEKSIILPRDTFLRAQRYRFYVCTEN